MANEVSLNIYLTTSEATALDKILTDAIELTGTFRDPCDVLNPVIEIQGSIASIAARNYFELPAFGRKYFITEMTSTGYGLCVIRGHVDVLSTYESQIRNLYALIARQENRYNLYLDDNLFKIDSRTIIQTKNFSADGGYFTTTPGIALVVSG